jgi:hypothetical protein
MSWFPQIGIGSMSQYPVRRTRTWRSIANELESRERILLPDAPAGEIEWEMLLKELTDTEVGKLSALFAATQGRFGSFVFVSPLQNLLGWSEDLSRPDWGTGLLSLASGIADLGGTRRAWRVTNGSPGTQALEQTVGIPGEYVACFSAYVRSDTTGVVTLDRDGVQAATAIGPKWKRALVNVAGVSGAAQASFSIVLAPGQTIDVCGLQVEVQPYPSGYMETRSARGIHEETYFGEDELKIQSTGAGVSSCEIVLLSRV